MLVADEAEDLGVLLLDPATSLRRIGEVSRRIAATTGR
jgi:hypothetical protein